MLPPTPVWAIALALNSVTAEGEFLSLSNWRAARTVMLVSVVLDAGGAVCARPLAAGTRLATRPHAVNIIRRCLKGRDILAM
jgi:hypothetical protein